MALGDLANGVLLVNPSLVTGVQFTCPNDGSIQTTPTVQKAISAVTGTQIYGAVTCSGACGKRFLVTLAIGNAQLEVQQTS